MLAKSRVQPVLTAAWDVAHLRYIQLQRYYRGAALELNRLQDISRSPIFQVQPH